MLQLVRNNNPFTVALLLIFTLLIKLHVLTHPLVPVAIDGYEAYNYLLYLLHFVFGQKAAPYTILAVMLLFGQALYLTRICNKHKLFSRPSYVPAYMLLLLSSVSSAYSYFNPTIVMNWCLLGGIDLLLYFPHTQQPRKHIFNAGYLFCMAGLIQFSAASYFVLFFAGLLMLRSFNLAEFLVALMGYFTPLYFFGGILFIIDKFDTLQHWPHLRFFFPLHIQSPFSFTVTMIGFVTLLVCSAYALFVQVPKSSIYTRRNWGALILYFLISVLVAFCTGSAVPSAWLIVMLPLSFVISMGIMIEKNTGFSNFIFYFSLLLVLFCQWVA